MTLKTTLAGLGLLLVVGCGTTGADDSASADSTVQGRRRDAGHPSDAGKPSDAGTDAGAPGDAGTPPPTDGGTPACSTDGTVLENNCVHSGWGSGLTTQFGRLDGTLTAIATPGSSQCSQSNSGHLILEVTMNGAPYALAVNVNDSASGSGVDFAELDHALVGVPWQEGWHTDAAEKLDYPSNLGVHSGAFQPYSPSALVNAVVCELSQGDQVSVYGLGWGPGGAHDIHRNSGGGGADGAIVVHANTAQPHYLMFHFVNQTF